MYTPTKGIFVNGRIADAVDLVNEFSAVASGIVEVDNKVVSATSEAETAAKAYTDTKFAALIIDGGSF